MYRKMDEELEDAVDDCSEASEIDPDYEFDAPGFFDFSRPEFDSEAQDAERWFESAQSYPPSPFLAKLIWGKDNALDTPEDASTDENSESSEDIDSITSDSESVHSEENDEESIHSEDDGEEYVHSEENGEAPAHQDHIVARLIKAKSESKAKSIEPRSSTLMKPTASHLAKQKPPKMSSTMGLGHLQNHLGLENLATKRQKLEYGYLSKVAHLKHQNLLVHKAAKKVTIPKEPDLETAQRAIRHRSRNNSESTEEAKPSTRIFKARPLNKKILNAPSLPLPKKSKPQLPKFQVFNLKTTERAMQHSSDNVLRTHNPVNVIQCGATEIKRPNTDDTQKPEKCETLNKAKASVVSKKDCQLPNDERVLHDPTVELLNKLSLKPEVVRNSKSHPKSHLPVKGLKENTPRSLQLGYWRSVGKSNQCGSDKFISKTKFQPHINRTVTHP